MPKQKEDINPFESYLLLVLFICWILFVLIQPLYLLVEALIKISIIMSLSYDIKHYGLNFPQEIPWGLFSIRYLVFFIFMAALYFNRVDFKSPKKLYWLPFAVMHVILNILLISNIFMAILSGELSHNITTSCLVILFYFIIILFEAVFNEAIGFIFIEKDGRFNEFFNVFIPLTILIFCFPLFFVFSKDFKNIPYIFLFMMAINIIHSKSFWNIIHSKSFWKWTERFKK